MRCLLLLAVACSSSSSSNGKPVQNRVEPDARSYELGKGVPRDYRMAAKLYRDKCADGCGDLVACRAYIDAALASRGALAKFDDVPLVARTCDRGDRVACMIAAMGAFRDPEKIQLEPRRSLSDRCDGGDIKACRDEIETDLGMSDSSTHEYRMNELGLKVCAAGVLSVCFQVLEEQWTKCEYSEGGASAGEACVEWQTAAWKQIGIDEARLRLAWKTVQDACADGDALACALVPGREIPKSARCKAGDYGVCTKLAESGDKDAAAVACAGGLTEHCTPPVKTYDHVLSGRGLAMVCKETNDPKVCAEAKKLADVTAACE